MGTSCGDEVQYLQIWCFVAFLWDYVKCAVYGYVGQLTILKELSRGLVQLWNQELQRCWIVRRLIPVISLISVMWWKAWVSSLPVETSWVTFHSGGFFSTIWVCEVVKKVLPDNTAEWVSGHLCAYECAFCCVSLVFGWVSFKQQI